MALKTGNELEAVKLWKKASHRGEYPPALFNLGLFFHKKWENCRKRYPTQTSEKDSDFKQSIQYYQFMNYFTNSRKGS